jgi:hypothetical protein
VPLSSCQERAREACGGGDLHGCFVLATLLTHGVSHRGYDVVRIEVMADPACAANLYDEACARGHLPSCSNRGLELVNTPADGQRGIRLLERACNGGYALGCANLGSQYQSGRLVPYDVVRAAELFQRACDARESVGCTHLGLAYAVGRGVPKDRQRAATLLRRGCDLGAAWACAELADHGLSDGTIKPPEARALYTRACERGFDYGCARRDALPR